MNELILATLVAMMRAQVTMFGLFAEVSTTLPELQRQAIDDAEELNRQIAVVEDALVVWRAGFERFEAPPADANRTIAVIRELARRDRLARSNMG
jgi:hypothetical protein